VLNTVPITRTADTKIYIPLLKRSTNLHSCPKKEVVSDIQPAHERELSGRPIGRPIRRTPNSFPGKTIYVHSITTVTTLLNQPRLFNQDCNYST
jgi:hypothetical protein